VAFRAAEARVEGPQAVDTEAGVAQALVAAAMLVVEVVAQAPEAAVMQVVAVEAAVQAPVAAGAGIARTSNHTR
jgi:hypothetical protein